MIRTSHSIATRFDTAVKTLSQRVDLEIAAFKDILVQVLRKLDEQFGKQAEVINNQAREINSSLKAQQKDNKKLLKLISLYSELSACGVMESKRKESLKSVALSIP